MGNTRNLSRDASDVATDISQLALLNDREILIEDGPKAVETIFLTEALPSSASGVGISKRNPDHLFSMIGSPLYENLGHAFLAAARCRATFSAIVTSVGAYSYAWVESAAWTVCNELVRRPSFHLGDRVVVLAGNSPEYVAAFYGILLAGGVTVPVPPDVEADRLQYILRECDVDIVLATLAARLQRQTFPEGRVTTLSLAEAQWAITENRDTGDRSSDDLALILFTSGSTGDPKGVMLSHGNLLSNAWSIGTYLSIGPDDRALAIVPFYHAFGNSVLQTHLLAGATLILDGTLTFPNTILDAIDRHRATSFSGVPEVYQILLSRSSLAERRLETLRYMTVAGGALRPDAAQRVARHIAPARFFVMYGQTEATARLSYLQPEFLETRPGSIGRGIPGVTLQVVDETGRPVAPGQRGEIRADGPNVMLGYWRDPQTSAQVLRDGWLYTGDWASVDAEGFIYPQGRSNALLKVAGFRVHPREIEEYVTRRLPRTQAVVVGFELEGTGTRPALFVQLGAEDRSLSVDQIQQICLSGLPRQKVPAYIEVMDRLPLNNAMKIDRPGLARRAARRAVVAMPTRQNAAALNGASSFVDFEKREA